MGDVFFSIIVPVYNTERFLKECIESVLRQTYSFWELILVDDGSSDSSGTICDYYANLDDRIAVIHMENSGQYDSRKCGINIAKGIYCIGLDSDDYYETDCLQKIYNAIIESECDVISWNIRYVGDINQDIAFILKPKKKYTKQEYILAIVKTTNYSFCNKAFKTEYLRHSLEIGAPDNIRTSEDYMLIIGALCMTDYIYVIDDILYNYRQYGMSMSYDYSAKMICDRLDASEFAQEQLKKYSLLTQDIQQEECVSLLKSIGFYLEGAFKEKKITWAECRKIHLKSFYKATLKYEKRKFFDFEIFLVLKFFRFKCFFLINTLLFVKKIKRKVRWKIRN